MRLLCLFVTRTAFPFETHTVCSCSYFHGGGWTVGSIDSHDGVCQLLAYQNRMSVVSVAYRLAPEHMFPSAVDDAIASCTFILHQLRHATASDCDDSAAATAAAALWGVSPGAAVGVGGDSAGGTLAAVAAQHLRSSLSFQLLIYPFTDGHRANASDTVYNQHVRYPLSRMFFVANSSAGAHAARD
jgi:acetyl esterase